MPPQGSLLTLAVTITIVALCVTLHYEGMRFVTARVPLAAGRARRRVVVLIYSLLLMHIAEIWLFGLGFYVLLAYFDVGELVGMESVNLFDCVYFSASAYTTIGFGDIVPTGALRLMTGSEGVTGLVMITWSASYTFAVMLKTWDLDD